MHRVAGKLSLWELVYSAGILILTFLLRADVLPQVHISSIHSPIPVADILESQPEIDLSSNYSMPNMNILPLAAGLLLQGLSYSSSSLVNAGDLSWVTLPSLAQRIDQRSFNVLPNVLPPLEFNSTPTSVGKTVPSDSHIILTQSSILFLQEAAKRRLQISHSMSMMTSFCL